MSKHKKNNSNSLKSCTMYVEGMHCASCELLVEKKLLRQSNVESVEASLKDNSVTFTYSADKPDLREVNNDLQKFGYKLVDHKPKSTRVPLLNYKKNEVFTLYRNLNIYTNIHKIKKSIRIYIFSKMIYIILTY